MTTLVVSDAIRRAGLCSRCQHYTTDGVLLVVDQDSAAGGRMLLCADIKKCDERRR